MEGRPDRRHDRALGPDVRPPGTRELFLLDPTNTGHTLTALAFAAASIVLIEITRWIGRFRGAGASA